MGPGVELVISEGKVRNYLLSVHHPSGGPKAKFFIAVGFSPAKWDELAEALRVHATKENLTKVVAKSASNFYVFEGEIPTPSKRSVTIRSVWVAVPGSSVYTLVTAYPLRRMK